MSARRQHRPFAQHAAAGAQRSSCRLMLLTWSGRKPAQSPSKAQASPPSRACERADACDASTQHFSLAKIASFFYRRGRSFAGPRLPPKRQPVARPTQVLRARIPTESVGRSGLQQLQRPYRLAAGAKFDVNPANFSKISQKSVKKPPAAPVATARTSDILAGCFRGLRRELQTWLAGWNIFCSGSHYQPSYVL